MITQDGYARAQDGTLKPAQVRSYLLELLGKLNAIYLFLTPLKLTMTNRCKMSGPPSSTNQHHGANETLNAFERATKVYNLCPNRIAMLGHSLPNGMKSLPDVFPIDDPSMTAFVYQSENSTFQRDHQDCTVDLCEMSQKNFTSVKQRHESSRCRKRPCFAIGDLFLSEALNVKTRSGDEPTAWHLAGRTTVTDEDDYMAISHVWSDGTGAGLDTKGVNTCLINFFRDVAIDLGCTGLWWDTLCIPTEKAARARAIKMMHRNFSRAKYTLVHDCFLRNIEWTDAETACLAIVVSPWFSRGWTALELARSNKVKVIFKNGNSYVLKDLDEDILAKASSKRHRLLAGLVNDLRKDITDLDQLLRVLKPRHTSWSIDMAIIAELLTEKVSSSSSHMFAYPGERLQHAMNIRTAANIGAIRHGNLFHNLPTINSGTSWCPSKFLSLPLASGRNFLRVDENGNVVGVWIVRSVDQVLKEAVISIQDADSLNDLRILAHLESPKYHYLLLEPGGSEVQRGILVQRHTRSDSSLYFQFIGAIFFKEPFLLDEEETSKMSITVVNSVDPWIVGTATIDRGPSAAHDTEEAMGECLETGETPKVQDYQPQVVPLSEPSTELRLLDLKADTSIATLVREGQIEAVQELLKNLRIQQESQLTLRQVQIASVSASYANESAVNHRSMMFTLQFDQGDQLGRTPLHHAVREARLDIVRLLTSWFEINIDAQDDDGMTPLLWALLENRTEIALLLIRIGARLEKQDHNKRTALHHAALNGNLAVIKQLLNAKVDVDCKDGDGRTPFLCAASAGREDAVELLLQPMRTILTDKDNEGRDSLSYASQNGMVSTVKLLLDDLRLFLRSHTLSFSRSGKTPLSYASWYGHLEVVKLLLHYEINLTEQGGADALVYAATRGHLAVVEVLLEHGVNANLRYSFKQCLRQSSGYKDGSSNPQSGLPSDVWISRPEALGTEHFLGLEFERGVEETAVGHLYTAQYLGLPKVKMNFANSNGCRPLHVAAMSGHVEIVEMLLAAGARAGDKDADDRTAACLAAMRGHSRVLKILVNQRASVDSEDSSLRRPLSFAAANGHEETVKLLLGVGNTRPYARDKTGRTALIYAAENGYWTIVAALLNAESAGVDMKDELGRTALSYAAERGHARVVQELLERGHADIDAMDRNHRTALSYAVGKGRAEVVNILLSKSADPNCTDATGHTPLAWAITIGDSSIVEAFVHHGVHMNEDDRLWAEQLGRTEIIRLLQNASTGEDTASSSPQNMAGLSRDSDEIVTQVRSDQRSTALICGQ